MSNGKDAPLTLADIRGCMKNYENNLVYQQDHMFIQVTSQPTWMRAMLTKSIIDCMTQKSGVLLDSEATNFMGKKLKAESHKVAAKFKAVYSEVKIDGAIEEEETQVRIALGRCAYVSSLDDSQKWGDLNQISDRYNNALAGIISLSPDGERLARKIKSSLIESFGLKIGRQCLPYSYTKNDDQERRLPSVLEAIDGVKLLTAAIITALNYQNNSLERRENDKEVDALTRRIQKYLLPEERTPSSEPAGGSSYQEPSASSEKDAFRASFERMISKLVDDAAADISKDIDDIVSLGRRAQFTEALYYAKKILGNCEDLVFKGDFSIDVHLSLMRALFSVLTKLSMLGIDISKEKHHSYWTRYDSAARSAPIETNSSENEKKQESAQFTQAVEQLQQDGLSQDSILSLHIKKRPEDK